MFNHHDSTFHRDRGCDAPGALAVVVININREQMFTLQREIDAEKFSQFFTGGTYLRIHAGDEVIQR